MGAPRERPILFSAPMVKAILEDRKTQTRRIIKPQPKPWALNDAFLEWGGGSPLTLSQLVECGPYERGMTLWVRETHSVIMDCAYHDGVNTQSSFTITYKAGGERHIDYDGPMGGDETYCRAFDSQRGEWRSSIFMPRWASRITLRVTDVRVQRLQEISEEDAEAEGVEPYTGIGSDQRVPGPGFENVLLAEQPHRLPFADLWDSINKGAPWTSNPWVWRVSFELV